MAEIHFHSGDKNALAVNIEEMVIDVEFNPVEIDTFDAMLWELRQIVKTNDCFHLQDIAEFVMQVRSDDSLWDKRGDWIGQYARSFKHE